MSNEQFQSSSLAPHDGMSGSPDTSPDSETAKQQFPIGAGGFDNVDDLQGLTDEPTGSKLNSSVVVLGIVVICGGAVLFWMKQMSAANTSAFAANNEIDTQIENFLDTMIVTDENGTEESNVLNRLTHNYTERQVKIDEVQKNPFILDTDKVDQAVPIQALTDPADYEIRQWEKRREEAKAQMESASKQIVINSIMSGSNPLASLNGKIVRIGDKFTAGAESIPFVVESIDTNTVSLVAESEEFDLRLGFTVSLKR